MSIKRNRCRKDHNRISYGKGDGTGAMVCNSARARLLSIGCIQALQCNIGILPLLGVATQNRSLVKGLVVRRQGARRKIYHEATIHSFSGMIAAAGLEAPKI